MTERSKKEKTGPVEATTKSHHNRRWRSRAATLVPSRLALGAAPDSDCPSDLCAGLAGGIYMG